MKGLWKKSLGGMWNHERYKMALKVIKGDVLEADTESIILTIDGSAEGMEGNIARLFNKKYSDAWENIEDEMIYPLSLGSVKLIKIDTDIICNFKYALIASTLHHKYVLQKRDIYSIIRNAFIDAIQTASANKISSLAATIMAGGWRLSASEAFRCMIDAYKSIQLSLTYMPIIKIYTISENDFKIFLKMAKDLGLLYKSNENFFIVE